MSPCFEVERDITYGTSAFLYLDVINDLIKEK